MSAQATLDDKSSQTCCPSGLKRLVVAVVVSAAACIELCRRLWVAWLTTAWAQLRDPRDEWLSTVSGQCGSAFQADWGCPMFPNVCREVRAHVRARRGDVGAAMRPRGYAGDLRWAETRLREALSRGRLNITVIGNSITQGCIGPEGTAWPHRLRELLLAHKPRGLQEVSLQVLADSGASMYYVMHCIRAVSGPDVVFVDLSMGDTERGSGHWVELERHTHFAINLLRALPSRPLVIFCELAPHSFFTSHIRNARHPDPCALDVRKFGHWTSIVAHGVPVFSFFDLMCRALRRDRPFRTTPAAMNATADALANVASALASAPAAGAPAAGAPAAGAPAAGAPAPGARAAAPPDDLRDDPLDDGGSARLPRLPRLPSAELAPAARAAWRQRLVELVERIRRFLDTPEGALPHARYFWPEMSGRGPQHPTCEVHEIYAHVLAQYLRQGLQAQCWPFFRPPWVGSQEVEITTRPEERSGPQVPAICFTYPLTYLQGRRNAPNAPNFSDVVKDMQDRRSTSERQGFAPAGLGSGFPALVEGSGWVWAADKKDRPGWIAIPGAIGRIRFIARSKIGFFALGFLQTYSAVGVLTCQVEGGSKTEIDARITERVSVLGLAVFTANTTFGPGNETLLNVTCQSDGRKFKIVSLQSC